MGLGMGMKGDGDPMGFEISNPHLPLENMTPLEILNRMGSAKVSQSPQFLETLGMCELENEYTVFAGNEDDPNIPMEDVNRVFSCREHSTCLQRHCCNGDAREFNVDLNFKRLKFNPTVNNYILNGIHL